MNTTNTKQIIDKVNDIYDRMFDGTASREETRWIDDEYPFELAKALYKEIPYIEKVAKMICVMDNSLKITIS